MSLDNVPGPVRWILVFPGVFASAVAASVSSKIMWWLLEDKNPVFQFEQTRIAILVIFVPYVAVYAAGTIAPSSQDKVAWIFAALWAFLAILLLVPQMSQIRPWLTLILLIVLAGSICMACVAATQVSSEAKSKNVR